MGVDESVRRQPQLSATAFGLFLVGVLAILDTLNGPDLSLELFYLLPISVVAWFAGRRTGILMSVAGTAAWFLARHATGLKPIDSFLPFWDALSKLGFFLAAACTLPSLKREWELLKESGRTDYLTSACNRNSFETFANLEIHRSLRYQHPFTVVYLDIDKFKFVNERFGHNMGDTLLRAVAQTIKGKIRTSDILARMGGDEFALLLPETQSEAAQIVVRRIQRHLLDAAQKNEWPVSFSFGVATFLRPPESVHELIRKADALLVAAKSSGGNNVRHEVIGRVEVT